MIKYICDVCKKEISDNKFHCEIMVRKIENKTFLTHASPMTAPQMFEKHFNLCKECFGEKLKELD